MMVKIPSTSDNTPELEWVEVDTGALSAGNTQLEGIQQRIATFTIDNNALRPGTLTATQSSLESQGSNAALRAFAVSLSEHVRDVIELMASYTLDADDDIKGYIAPEFNSAETESDVRLLLEMRRNLDISRETMVKAAVQRRLLPPDFDTGKNYEELDEEIERNRENAEELESIQSNMNTAQQASEGLLAGDGNEQITDQARDA